MKSSAKTMSICLMLVLALGLFLPVSSQATITLLTARNPAATDHIDWSVLGPAFPIATVVSNPFTISTTVKHLTVQVSQPSAPAKMFTRFDQIPPDPVGWGGNFAPGAELIFSFAPMDLVFPNFLSIFQTQIQSNYFGAFTATIEALDPANHVLASFDVHGNSTFTADNSAIVVGLSDDLATMNHIRLIVPPGVTAFGFAINTVDTLNGAPVTLPPAVWLLDSGLLGLVGFRRFRA
jgi:hypothetical protein